MRLEDHEFFAMFPAEQAKDLQGRAEVVKFTEPHVLFEEGDEGGTMYLVLDGEVEISGMTASGNYQAISSLGPGEFFGEFSSIDGGPRSARVEVPLMAELAAIHRDALLQALDKAPVAATQQFISRIIRRIRNFHQRFFTDIVRSQKMLLIGELTNSIIHDLKSPMGIITGTTEMLKDQHRDMETKHLCELIDMQVKRMQDMTREVLDFVRGSTTLVQKSVNLEDLFPYFALMNQDYFRRQGVELVVHPADVSFNADPDKIVRVLQNLTNNAAQAMPNGGQIEIRGEEHGDWIQITVADNGPGIPEDIQAHLFDPFVSANRNGGTGLGTTIAKSLVQSHGGKIDFATTPNGTTFTIDIPKRLDAALSRGM